MLMLSKHFLGTFLFKAQYYHPWVVIVDGVMCPALLDGWKLD
jgi:hypothetical protein